jgi:hypothetical protein
MDPSAISIARVVAILLLAGCPAGTVTAKGRQRAEAHSCFSSMHNSTPAAHTLNLLGPSN